MGKGNNANPLGIQGVVFAKGTGGGVRVATDMGVLGTLQKKDFYIPKGNYTVKNPALTIPDQLAAIRDSVMDGTYNPSEWPTRTIMATQREQLQLPGNASTKKKEASKNCKCAKQCGPRCGCHKRGVACTTSCACGGNCGQGTHSS